MVEAFPIPGSATVAALLAAMLLISADAVAAAEVTSESIIDQASALRAASSQVPAGARVLGSTCQDIALPGLSFRYRCSVRFEPAQPAAPARPGAAPAAGATP